MARPKQTAWRQDATILARLIDVERRHLAGETHVAIAAALGVDEKTIRNDLTRLRTLWLERTAGTVEQLKAEALIELDDVKRRALAAAAFDEAAERAVLFNDVLPDAKGETQYVYRDEKGSASFRGNKSGALNVARQAIMDKAKVRGLLVDKVAETDSTGRDLSLAELQARYAAAHPAPAEDAGAAHR